MSNVLFAVIRSHHSKWSCALSVVFRQFTSCPQQRKVLDLYSNKLTGLSKLQPLVWRLKQNAKVFLQDCLVRLEGWNRLLSSKLGLELPKKWLVATFTIFARYTDFTWECAFGSWAQFCRQQLELKQHEHLGLTSPTTSWHNCQRVGGAKNAGWRWLWIDGGQLMLSDGELFQILWSKYR